MRHEQIIPAHSPFSASQASLPDKASTRGTPKARAGTFNDQPIARATTSAPAAPPLPPHKPIRLEAPACAWHCKCCEVRCASATGLMRSLKLERAVLLHRTALGSDLSYGAELARLEWDIAEMQVRIDKMRGEVFQAEIDERHARRAADRSTAQQSPASQSC